MRIVLNGVDRTGEHVSETITILDQSSLSSSKPVLGLIQRLMLSSVLEQGAWLLRDVMVGIALAFSQQRCRCFSMDTRLFVSGMGRL